MELHKYMHSTFPNIFGRSATLPVWPMVGVFTIAFDVVGLPTGEAGTLPGRVDVGFGASQLMMQSITNIKLAANPPDLFLRPNVDAFRVLDFLKVKEILKATQPIYDKTCRELERLLAL